MTMAARYKTDAVNELRTIDYVKARITQIGIEIEKKLGAHPSYADAQAKLVEAIGHLSHATKEVKESIAFTSGQTTPEQVHALAEHEKFVQDRIAGQDKPDGTTE